MKTIILGLIALVLLVSAIAITTTSASEVLTAEAGGYAFTANLSENWIVDKESWNLGNKFSDYAGEHYDKLGSVIFNIPHGPDDPYNGIGIYVHGIPEATQKLSPREILDDFRGGPPSPNADGIFAFFNDSYTKKDIEFNGRPATSAEREGHLLHGNGSEVYLILVDGDKAMYFDVQSYDPKFKAWDILKNIKFEKISQTKPGNETATTSGWSWVRVISSTSWSGSFGGAGSSRTIEGYGNKAIPVSKDLHTVAAVVHKKTEGGSLKVQILEDGEVVDQGETTAAYGVVSVTS